MSISYASALTELSSTAVSHTVSSLFDLVDRVSGAVQNSASSDTYLLFSGLMPDGTTTAGNVAAEVVNNSTGGVHDIGSCDVGKLLDRPEFHTKLKQAIATEYFGISYAAATTEELLQVEAKYKELLFGTDINGRRINSTSIWDIASAKYVAEAEGNFRIMNQRGQRHLVF